MLLQLGNKFRHIFMETGSQDARPGFALGFAICFILRGLPGTGGAKILISIIKKDHIQPIF